MITTNNIDNKKQMYWWKRKRHHDIIADVGCCFHCKDKQWRKVRCNQHCSWLSLTPPLDRHVVVNSHKKTLMLFPEHKYTYKDKTLIQHFITEELDVTKFGNNMMSAWQTLVENSKPSLQQVNIISIKV